MTVGPTYVIVGPAVLLNELACNNRKLGRMGSILLGAGLFALSACQPKAAPGSVTPASSNTPTATADTAPCKCECNCETQSREIRELTRSAQKKIAHHDAGCMDDLNRIRKLDAGPGAAQGGIWMDTGLGYMRAQCEMVAGYCDAGRARILELAQEQQGLGPDMAEKMADGLVSMHCRSSDASARDRLLGAMYDLQDGAYMNRRSADFCQRRVSIVRELLPRVRPKGPDDHQIETAPDTVYLMASKCLGHAGDCSAAWATFEELHPRHRFDGIPAAQRHTAMRTTFESVVSECKR